MSIRINRREFIRQTLSATAIAAGGAILGPMERAGAATSAAPGLVAVQNAEPGPLFDAAINAAGGMSRYVKQGQTVVIKPNIGWNREPDTGANTHPALVQRIVEHAVQAGAKRVYVFDHAVEDGQACYRTSGIEAAVKAGGGTLVPGGHEKYYQQVSVPGGEKLTSTKVHELILESDVYINVPVLKHHASSGLSLCMKNQMGVVWNRGTYHWRGLHDCITDFCRFRKPDLNIMDAYRITLRNGPSRANARDIAVKKMLLLSEDIVAIDAASAKIFGIEPDEVNHIVYAHKAGLGSMDLSAMDIRRITLNG